MSGKPWLKFYPRDWRAESRLRLCSLSARGLWIELIGYMHEAEPYGHLLIDGRSPEVEDLAALVGRPVTEVRKAMAELSDKGVYSRSGGTIFSRRMMKDAERSEEGRRQIEKRWPRSPNRSDDKPPNRSPTSLPIRKNGG